MTDLSDKKRALLKTLLEKEGLRPGALIPRRTEGAAPLSFVQERLWYLDRLSPRNPAYNIPVAYRLSGPLDAAGLEKALNAVVQRHENLRTRFPRGEAPSQLIAGELHIPLPLEAIEGDVLEERIRAEARAPFDLAEGPLLRGRLLRLGEEDHVLLLTLHHIIGDGWSFAVLLGELSRVYNAHRHGEAPLLPPVERHYADFARWQRMRSRSDDLLPQVRYWQERLAGAIEPLELPADHPRPPVQSFNGRWLERILPPGLAEAARMFARSEGVTLLSVVLAAFKLLLKRYTGVEDIVIGSPVTNRTRVELEGMIGHFINTQALRTDLSGDPGFRELVGRVRETLVGAYANQEVPFERVMETVATNRDPGRSPLFQIAFILQDMPAQRQWRSALTLDGLQIEPLFTHSGTAKFDLSVELENLPQGFTLSMEYNSDLFEEETIRRLGGHYESLLRAALADPDAPISTLPMLATEEKDWLARLNNTQTAYPREGTLQELFEARAAAAPVAQALAFRAQTMSYGELNRRANRVAVGLLARGLEPETPVGIAAGRSFELVAGILGILKAGGAYVPIDLDLPAARVAFILEDTGAPVVLVQDGLMGKFQALGVKGTAALSLDELAGGPLGDPLPDPPIRSAAGSLAYIMYTSGSTGQPKGAGVTQRGVIRLVRDTNFIALDSQQTTLLISPISFDATTFEIWAALLNGGLLAIAPPGRLSYGDIGSAVRDGGVSTLFLTSGLFHQMVEQHIEGFESVSTVITGGDVVSASHAGELLRRYPDIRFINAYGPTENAAYTTTYVVDKAASVGSKLLIGSPIANTSVYILDPDLNPVPAGVPGELYTGGDGVARGYIGRPGLTAGRFLPDPFAGGGARMYRTGDLARRLPDGAIDFLGRADFQVKLRGFRIELGEIEAALRQQPGIEDAAVLARKGEVQGGRRLVAYVVPGDNPPEAAALRRGLAATLPDYMLPAAFVTLDSFPLTPNGKLDRRRLPDPGGGRPALESAFTAPGSEAEKTIASIWCEVLSVDRVGLDDNFFDLGGHSLLMLQVHGRLEAAFEREIPVVQMFSAPTVRSMARYLGGENAADVDMENLGARGEARRKRMRRRRG